MKNSFLYNRPDLQSFRQALSIASDKYLVYRQVTNHFNEKGRPDSKVEPQLMEMAIIPKGNYSVNRKEQGNWTSETFSVEYVYPDELKVDDIIEHPIYGKLRISSINDMTAYGVGSAEAERINSSRTIVNPQF